MGHRGPKRERDSAKVQEPQRGEAAQEPQPLAGGSSGSSPPIPSLEVFPEVIRRTDISEVLTQKTEQIGRDLTLNSFLYSFPAAETLELKTDASFLTALESRSLKSKCRLGPLPPGL